MSVCLCLRGGRGGGDVLVEFCFGSGPVLKEGDGEVGMLGCRQHEGLAAGALAASSTRYVLFASPPCASDV